MDFESKTSDPSGMDSVTTEHAAHYVRPRINSLLAQAAKNPLVVLCAGIGYGKTLAVSDFIRENNIPVIWIQFTEFDNIGLSFWERFVRALEHLSKSLAEECMDIGFPDTEDKLNQYIMHRDRLLVNYRYFTVFDDLHLVKDEAVLRFIEHIIYNTLPYRTVIVMCRELPKLNLSGLLVRGLLYNLDEKDLSFTETEVTQYLLQQGLSAETHNLSAIYNDTEGWAFILNFLVRILKKTPGYTGYVRSFMKQNVNQLMEREAWKMISERLQHFMARLSLINRLSEDLVTLIAEGDVELEQEFRQQRVMYIRFDSFSGCYLIHNLFMDYLRSKQAVLSDEEVRSTLRIAADWSIRNGFNVDALTYYEKIGDYEKFINIIQESSSQVLLSVAKHLKEVFERTPEEVFDTVEFFACGHVRILILAGCWSEAQDCLIRYEQKFKGMPKNSEFRNNSLGVLYYLWGLLRRLMCTTDDVYDFDKYLEKMSQYPARVPEVQIHENYPTGTWLNRAGMSRRGAPQEFLDSLTRSVGCIANGPYKWMEGQDDLCAGEMLFYQGEIEAAKARILNGLERAEKARQFPLVHNAMFVLLRIAAWQGNYAKTEQVIKDMEVTLEVNEYLNRFSTYDMTVGMYYYILRQPEKIPGWLKGKFAQFSLTNFLDNSGNLIKARYFYLSRNYAGLLAFLEERKRWELPLYGRVEMLAMEACVHYQLKDKQKALEVLLEAYETASPNGIISPFAEMGKDIRTLTLTALRETDCKIPAQWLRVINQKASVYARHQTLLISEYKKAHDINAVISLSHRETEVLHDLYKGFSRSEIASNQGLSINTVRLIVNTIYEKLQARNITELIRIVHEQGLI